MSDEGAMGGTHGRSAMGLWLRMATAARVAIVAAPIALAVACGADTTAAEHLDRASEYRADGDRRAAIIEVRNALQQEPDDAEARALLGRLYVEAEDMASAEKELTRALDLGASRAELAADLGRALLARERHERLLERLAVDDAWPGPVRAAVLAQRSRAHVALGQHRQARAALERAEALDPGHVEVHLAAMDFALADGDPAAARERGEQAIAQHPDAAELWRMVARAASADGDAAAAEAAFDEAIAHGVHRAPDYLQRARLRFDRGDFDGARADLDALPRGVRDAPQVQLVRGLLLFAEDERERACSTIQQVVADAPGLVEARYYHGACLFHAGEFNQAEAQLRWVHQRQPIPPVARLLAAAQLELGETDRARRALNALIQQYPDDAAARSLLARIELEAGNTMAAVEHLEALARLRPDDPAARLQLGRGLMRAGAAGEGERVLAEALALDPDLEGAGELLVVSLLERGEFRRAIEEAEHLAEQRPDEALPLLLAAAGHLALEDEAAAREALERGVRRQPADPSVRHGLARLAQRDGDAASARRHYERVLDESPDHVPTLVALAALESGTGSPGQARGLLERAHAADPQAHRPRIELARLALERAGDPAAALEWLMDDADAVPDHPSALAIAARAHLGLGDPEAAIGHLESLIEAEPGSADARVLMARAHGQAGRAGATGEWLDRALELEPRHAEARIMAARLRLAEGEDAAAREHLARLPGEYVSHPAVLFTRGVLAERAGRAAEAADYYTRAHRAAPQRDTVLRLGRVLRRDGRPDEAADVLAQWTDDHPGDTTVLRELAGVHLALGRDRAAIEIYRDVLEHEPDSVNALNNLAWLLRERDPAQAVHLAERAVEAAPDSPAVRDTLGVALLNSGEVERALRHLGRAVHGAPEQPAMRYHLALALHAAGRDAEAREHLRRVLSSERDFDERAAAQDLLERLEG